MAQEARAGEAKSRPEGQERGGSLGWDSACRLSGAPQLGSGVSWVVSSKGSEIPEPMRPGPALRGLGGQLTPPGSGRYSSRGNLCSGQFAVPQHRPSAKMETTSPTVSSGYFTITNDIIIITESGQVTLAQQC